MTTPHTPDGATRAPRRRAPWILLTLALLPFVEIAVLVLVGRQIGFWWTLLLIVGIAVAGLWLVRRETGRTYRALQEAMNSGQMPADRVTDAILIMLGGFLLVLPGFVTDLVGLLLVLPFTRPLARRLLKAVIAARAVSALGAHGYSPQQAEAYVRGTRSRSGEVIEGEVVAEEPPPGSAGDDAPPSLDR